MGQVISILIIIVLVIFTFVPMSLLNDSRLEVQDLKHNINLAARALGCAVDKSEVQLSYEDYEKLSEGFERSDTVIVSIDKQRLLDDFNDILYKNYYDSTRYSEVKHRILLKALVDGDKFFISGSDDNWGPPYYFLFNSDQPDSHQVYINTLNDDAFFYDVENNKTAVTINDFYYKGERVDRQTKNDIIIDRINTVISGYTQRAGRSGSLSIKIRNPDRKDSTD